MKRSGFTLIELIFVIVIIGVLAAVAVPKFKNLKQSAEVNNVVKMIKDAESSVPSAVVNVLDLNGSDTTLSNILTLNGKNIKYIQSGSYDVYEINDTKTQSNNIAKIALDDGARTLTTSIDCNGFSDTTSQTKCADALGVTNAAGANEYNATISF